MIWDKGFEDTDSLRIVDKYGTGIPDHNTRDRSEDPLSLGIDNKSFL